MKSFWIFLERFTNEIISFFFVLFHCFCQFYLSLQTLALLQHGWSDHEVMQPFCSSIKLWCAKKLRLLCSKLLNPNGVCKCNVLTSSKMSRPISKACRLKISKTTFFKMFYKFSCYSLCYEWKVVTRVWYIWRKEIGWVLSLVYCSCKVTPLMKVWEEIAAVETN